MAHIRREVIVEAPVERVFGYARNLKKLPEWWASLVEARTPQELAEVGVKYEWTYKMLGLTFKGTGEVVEVAPDRRIVVKTHGGIPSTVRHDFTPEGNNTRWVLTVDYDVPAKLGGRFTDKLFVERFNEKEADHVVANLKQIVEASAD